MKSVQKLWAAYLSSLHKICRMLCTFVEVHW